MAGMKWSCKVFSSGYILFFAYAFLSTILMEIQMLHLVESYNETVAANETADIYYEEDAIVFLQKISQLLPIVGALFAIDSQGYKFACYIPLLGLAIAGVVSMLPGNVEGLHSVAGAYVATVLYGLSGGLSLMRIGAFCHVIKYSEVRTLSVWFGWMFSAELIGRGLGYGVIASRNYTLFKNAPIPVTAVSALLLLATCLSSDTDRERSTGCTQGKFFQPYSRKEVAYLLVTAGVLMLHQTCDSSQLTATKILVLDNAQLNWTRRQLDIYRMFTELSRGAGNVFLMPIFIRHFYLQESTIVLIACACESASLALTSFATESWMIYLSCPIDIIDGLSLSCLLSIIIRLASPKDGRKILCIISIGWIFLECSGRLATTAIAVSPHSAFYGTSFVLLTVTMVAIFCCTLWLSIDLRTHKHRDLLGNFSMSDVNDDGDVTDDEQWLVNACDNDVTSEEGMTADGDQQSA